jgi:hypothetical protein
MIMNKKLELHFKHPVDFRRTGEEIPRLNPNKLYPTLRPIADVKRMNRDGYGLLYDSEVPGMATVLVERQVGFTLLLSEEMLSKLPEWNKQTIREQAYRNLRKKGWRKPNLLLQSPACERSMMHIYLDTPIPIQCQLLLPDLTCKHLPRSFIAGFPNKETTIILSYQGMMETHEEVRQVAKISKVHELVERSYSVQPYPLSDRLYWIRNGEAKLI